jgi:hypothetical protein
VAVSAVQYPADTAAAADSKSKVTATLVLADGTEKVYNAKFVKNGSFQATIPAKDLSGLKAGSYTLVVQSAFSTEAPSVVPTSLVLLP